MSVLQPLLDRLGIESGDLVYLHSSCKYMSYLGLDARGLLVGVLEQLGASGTLVLPAFAWHLDRIERPWKGFADYFQQRPPFDVRNTPANIGLLPELFRQTPGVARSGSFWWSVCAIGPLSSWITSDQEAIEQPFGPGSSFDRMRVKGVKVLGLGVSLNTLSFAFMPDASLGHGHTQQVFTPDLQEGVVIDARGRLHTTRSYWVLPEAVRRIKPSAVLDRSPRMREAMRRSDYGGTIQFAYPYAVYHEEALRLGVEACERGLPVPWLEQYPLRQAGSPVGRGFVD